MFEKLYGEVKFKDFLRFILGHNVLLSILLNG